MIGVAYQMHHQIPLRLHEGAAGVWN